MENEIDQLGEKNHDVFHHKSSMKLVMCPKRKRRLLVGFVRLWDLALHLGPAFSFYSVPLPWSPSSAPPSTLTVVLLPGQHQDNLLQGAFQTQLALPLYVSHLLSHLALCTWCLQTVLDRPIFPNCTLMFYIWTQTYKSQKSRLLDTCSNS